LEEREQTEAETAFYEMIADENPILHERGMKIHKRNGDRR
jgi:hypothetical protein